MILVILIAMTHRGFSLVNNKVEDGETNVKLQIAKCSKYSSIMVRVFTNQRKEELVNGDSNQGI
jgi:hypothetical protein